MSNLVYIPSQNVRGEIVKEMAYGAYIKYIVGGIEYVELMDSDDYDILDHMFFNYEENE